VLNNGVGTLIKPISVLMSLIYIHKESPDQWPAAKTVPVYKNKGANKDIENYRLIANLCFTSTVLKSSF
jgi:hypothetical protein